MNQFISPKIEPFKPKPHPWGFSFDVESNYEKLLPVVLILDEATASVDTEAENLLEKAISASFSGRTSVVIAHRLSPVRRADRIVVMDRGSIVEQGNHSELMEKHGAYADLITMDLEQR